MASAKMASAIGVRIDDVGSTLKLRIGFPSGEILLVFASPAEKNADFRRKPQDFCRLGSVTLGPSPLARP